MIGRWLDKLPRKLGLGLMIGVGVLGLGVLGFGAWLIIYGGAPGGNDRYLFLLLSAMVLLRFSKNSALKPGTTKRTIDILALAALAFCVLWYLRTGTPTPFGASTFIWYAGAYLAGLGIGTVIERVRSRRAVSAVN
jgi:hypothetical protein